MAYATVAHVESYTPARAPYDGNTMPTDEQVVELLGDAAAEIEGCLTQAGYSVPVSESATVAYRIVQAAVAKCTAAAVERTAPTRDENNLKACVEMCQAAKKMILAGQLPGLDKDDAEVAPRSGYCGSPMFSRDMEL